MGIIIFVIVLAILGLGSVAIGGIAMKKGIAALAGAALLVFSALMIVTQSFTTVGTSDVKIEQAFGHTAGDLGPGVHAKPFWDSTVTWDDSQQSAAFQSGTGKDGCLVVHIINEQTMCLNVDIYWYDNPGDSDAQFKKYKTFGRLAQAYFSRIVVTKFFDAQFASFDPVTAAVDAAANRTPATVQSISAKVQSAIVQAYAGKVRGIVVNVGNPEFDPQVQQALNNITTAVAATKVAQQGIATATATQTANAKLAQGGLSALVVEQNCVAGTLAGVARGQQFPTWWSCTGSPALAAGGK